MSKKYKLRVSAVPALPRNTRRRLAATAAGVSASVAVGGDYLPRSVFYELFDVEENDGGTRLHIKGSAYADGYVSAYGIDSTLVPGAGGGTTDVTLLTSWPANGATEQGQALGASLGVELHSRVTTLEGAGHISGGDLKALNFRAGAFTSSLTGASYSPTVGATVNIPRTTDHVTEGSSLYFTDARARNAVSGYYLPLSGGTITGDLTVRGKTYSLYNHLDEWSRVVFGSGASWSWSVIGHNGTTALEVINPDNDNALAGQVRIGGDLRVGSTIHAAVGVSSDGYVSAYGVQTTSDARQKDVTGSALLPLDYIAAAPAVRFTWKGTKQEDAGSLAQYWQELLPEAVKDISGMLTLDYAKAALLSAISLAREVKKLKEEVEILRLKLQENH